MTEVFEAKLRKIGNSLGIIIPNEIIQEHGYDHGDFINVAIPTSDIKTRNKLLLAIAGMDSKKAVFKRTDGDRY